MRTGELPKTTDLRRGGGEDSPLLLPTRGGPYGELDDAVRGRQLPDTTDVRPLGQQACCVLSCSRSARNGGSHPQAGSQNGAVAGCSSRLERGAGAGAGIQGHVVNQCVAAAGLGWSNRRVRWSGGVAPLPSPPQPCRTPRFAESTMAS